MSYWVYIFTNNKHGTLYVGVTNHLARRTQEHKQGNGSKFTKKYDLTKLVYVEEFSSIQEAIAREKQIKNWQKRREAGFAREGNIKN